MRRIFSFILVATMAMTAPVFAETQAPMASPMVGAISNPAAAPADARTRAQKIWVEDIIGIVEIKGKDASDFKAIIKKTSVSTGDTIRTTEGACVLVLQNNARVTIAPNTTLVVNEATMNSGNRTRTTLLQLDAGKLKARVDKFSTASRFEVRTPTAVAAVRGTLFYLSAGTQIDQLFSELYVDDGTVFFENIFSHYNFLLPFTNASTAFSDGSLLAPRKLTAEEQQEFKENWENAIKDLLKKGGVEEINTDEDPDDDEQGNENNEGGDNERLSERNAEELADLFEGAAENIAAINGLIGNLDDLKAGLLALGFDPDIDFMKRKNDGLKEILLQQNLGPQGAVPTPPLNEWTYRVVELNNGEILPGDFDNDNDVDGGDYLAWQRGFGTIYDASHYVIWRDNYGTIGSTEGKDTAGDLGILDPQAAQTISDFLADFDSFDDATEQAIADVNELLLELADLVLLANLNPDNQALRDQAQQLYDDLLTQISLIDLQTQQDEVIEKYNQALEDLETRREQERQMMRTEIGRLVEALDFERSLAQIEKNSDAQTGKVFTDIHGNRVRVDQYVFQDDPNSVRVVSLTARTDASNPALNGVSAFVFGADFNTAIEQPLRTLPWDDYLNVVTRDELRDRLDHIRIEGEYFDYHLPSGFEEFIVYQEGSEQPGLYPKRFFAEFSNVANEGNGNDPDRVRFEEGYTAPFQIEAHLEEQGDMYGASVQSFGDYEGSNINLWVQARWTPVIVTVDPSGSHNSRVVFVDSLPFTAQSESFADSFSEENYEGAAGFEIKVGHDKKLYGKFIPIDNNGQVLTAPGFKLEGIRDFINPNPNLMGGNYNLEVILDYQAEDNYSGGGYNTFGAQSAGVSAGGTSFKIDTIITPEIFTEYGISNESSLFPRQSFDDDEPIIEVVED